MIVTWLFRWKIIWLTTNGCRVGHMQLFIFSWLPSWCYYRCYLNCSCLCYLLYDSYINKYRAKCCQKNRSLELCGASNFFRSNSWRKRRCCFRRSLRRFKRRLPLAWSPSISMSSIVKAAETIFYLFFCCENLLVVMLFVHSWALAVAPWFTFNFQLPTDFQFAKPSREQSWTVSRTTSYQCFIESSLKSQASLLNDNHLIPHWELTLGGKKWRFLMFARQNNLTLDIA